jgi:hypothetical protein
MKKFLKILLLLILALFVILAATPLLFKGKIVRLANEQLEKNLLANATFEDISLSLFRNFPNLDIRLKNVCIVGIDKFEGDTLLNIKTIDLAIDLMSALKMENIKIKRIVIDEPYINALVLEDGHANWDIVPEADSTSVEPVDTSASEFTTKISLKLFRIDQGIIRYTDLSSGTKASLDRFNFALTGDLSQDFSAIVINSSAEKVNLTMDGIRYLKDVLLNMHFDVDANLKESIYKLNENQFSLNDLTLMWNGSIEMPESGDIVTTLDFSTSSTNFKTLLSLIPAIYLNDYKDLKTTGNLKLEGKITGAVTETANPNIDAKLLVNNAGFSYPDLPKSAKNIQIDADLHYDGAQMDNTTIDVNKFHVDLGDNPVDMVLNLKNPVSDPFTNGKLTASINLESISDVIPLEETKLRGLIQAQLDWMGKLSSIENEQYENFKADGTININNFYYNSPEVPKAFTLKTSQFSFSPKTIEIASFDAIVGSSDFRLKGKLTNYIPYILKDETIQGELSLNSNQLDVNELMGETETTEIADEAEDTAALEVIEVPGNINFRFVSVVGKVLYDKLDIRNMEGIISLKDKKVLMENLSLNTLDGKVALSGEYNTVDISNPLVDLKISAFDIDIPKSVAAFNILGKVAPIASKATGKVSLGLTYSSFLNSTMKPVINTISSSGNLSSKQIGIKSADAFNAIGEALKTDALKNMTLSDVNLNFVIQEGMLTVEPFETKMGDISMLIGGQQSFDKTLDYSINFSAPRQLLGLENPAINNLYNSATAQGIEVPRSETVDVIVRLTGDIKNPKVKLDLKRNATNAVENVKEDVKEAVKDVIDTKSQEVKDNAKVKARAEADKIMKEAEKQAANVRSEAKKAADVVRAESNANANKIINEAKNPISKRAAEPAAKKLRDEGEVKARKIEQEANQKANKIVSDAKAKSDKLLQ